MLYNIDMAMYGQFPDFMIAKVHMCAPNNISFRGNKMLLDLPDLWIANDLV